MVRNFGLYKLKKLVIKDEDSRGILNSAMRTQLTTIQNSIKSKVSLAYMFIVNSTNVLVIQLDTATTNGHCINRIMSDIMPKQIEVTKEHEQRWAWIVCDLP